MDHSIEIGLFEFSPEGLRLLARSGDPALVELVRNHLTERMHPDGQLQTGAVLTLVKPADSEEDEG